MFPKHLLIEGIQGQSITSVFIKDKKPKTNKQTNKKPFTFKFKLFSPILLRPSFNLEINLETFSFLLNSVSSCSIITWKILLCTS